METMTRPTSIRQVISASISHMLTLSTVSWSIKHLKRVKVLLLMSLPIGNQKLMLMVNQSRMMIQSILLSRKLYVSPACTSTKCQDLAPIWQSASNTTHACSSNHTMRASRTLFLSKKESWSKSSRGRIWKKLRSRRNKRRKIKATSTSETHLHSTSLRSRPSLFKLRRSSM